MVPSDRRFSLEEFYDTYPRIETEFQAALDSSLHPRGPELLYGLVGDLRLPRGASVIDLGCGEGKHALELASRFGFSVHGIDPVARQIELANTKLAEAATRQSELRDQVHFELGTAEVLPADDESCDLVWCRDVLVHVAALDQAYATCFTPHDYFVPRSGTELSSDTLPTTLCSVIASGGSIG